jgi:hypothetical protein
MQESFVLKAKKAVKTVAAIGTGMAMLGATMTGAMALDLKDYPSPFVVSGKYDASNVLVVGTIAAASDTLGMVDIATNLQFESKECSPSSGTVSVSGGVSEDVPLGDPIASGASRTVDKELEDNQVSSLWDGEIAFQSASYDTRELIELGQGTKFSRISTSLTSNDDDYQTDVVLESDVDSIKYYYAFDDVIQLNKTTSTNPLTIKFLGKTLKITDIDSSTDNKFSAYVGTEYFMDVGDSVEVDGKKVTLTNVGEGGSIVIDVDGVVEVVTSTAKTVNGIEIKVDQTFYETVKAQRSASLILGKEAQQTYKDGDAYIGENKDDPNWVWNIGNLQSYSATTTSTTAEFTTGGPYLGVENDFTWNDAADNPPAIGECIELPNKYVSICLDSLTIKDTNYKTYTFELDKNSDLSKADNGDSTAASTLYFHTNQPEGFVVKTSPEASFAGDLISANGTISNPKTDKVWLWRCLNASGGEAASLGVYYKDSDGKTQMAGCIGGFVGDAAQILEVNYDSTKSTDMNIYAGAGSTTALNITVRPYTSADLPYWNDNITMEWTHTASDFSFTSLGASASSEEAGELTWNGYNETTDGNTVGDGYTVLNIGTKDNDLRSRYGIIIRDPKSHGSSDEVVLEIPGDQVQANVVVKGASASTSTSGEVCTVADITPVTKLDSEIKGSESMYNLIIVGGPCANGAVEAVPGLGITCAGWSLKPGEGIIKLAANGNKVALLVAGTDALDTRRAAKVIANYKDYTLSGTEALVKGTSLTDITVE